MISRVAESCFWLNRYVERVEVMARMLDVNQAFQLDVDLPDAERWRPLVVVAGQEADFLSRTKKKDLDDPEVVQKYLVWDEECASSIFFSLRAARENARTIRETISLEMWETLNDLWVWLGERGARRLYANDRHAFYLRVRNQCLLLHGVAQATMLHEDPFEFMRLGTALERLGQTARVLDVKHHSLGPEEAIEMPAEAAQWLATLRFCSGVEPFFKREEMSLSGPAVAHFLLLDRAFPRSALHNLYRLKNFVTLVRPPAPTSVGALSDSLITSTLDELDGMEIDDILEQGLHEVLTWLVESTGRIGAALHAEFFDPRLPAAEELERAGEQPA